MSPIHRIRVVLLASCLAAISAIPSISHAVTASVTPADTTVVQNTDFYMRVTIDAISDVKTYELVYSFDPLKLQLLGITGGDVLRSGGPGSYVEFVRTEYAPPADSAWFDAAVLVGKGSGPGVMAFLHFKAIGVGDSPLTALTVDIRDSENHQTLPAKENGTLHVTGPVPVRPTSWARLKSLYR